MKKYLESFVKNSKRLLRPLSHLLIAVWALVAIIKPVNSVLRTFVKWGQMVEQQYNVTTIKIILESAIAEAAEIWEVHILVVIFLGLIFLSSKYFS